MIKKTLYAAIVWEIHVFALFDSTMIVLNSQIYFAFFTRVLPCSTLQKKPGELAIKIECLHTRNKSKRLESR
jgi:hypothetical protein